MRDVIVVGGGAMGSAAAWQLAGRGVDTLLLERFEPGHTRGASHGASRIFRMTYADQAHQRLAAEAYELWRELELVSGEKLLTITGGLSHGDPQFLERLQAGLDAGGSPGEWLGAAEAERRWPGLRIATRALFNAESGRLHADRSVATLQAAARAAGAQVRHTSPVERLRVLDDDLVEIALAGGEVVRARRVVVAVGAWTAKLTAGLLTLPSLRVTQEQPAHFAVAPGYSDDWPSFGHLLTPGTDQATRFSGVAYGLATPGEGVKVGFHGVGPEVDPDRRDYRPRPDLAAALEEYVRTWLPGLRPDTAVPISCTYTTPPDSVFVLDRQGPVVVAAGFSGEGFKFTPAIGRVLADLAVTGTRPDPLFSLSRPREPRVGVQ